MKQSNSTMKAWLVSGLLLIGYGASAQFTGSYQFPQNTSYLGGRKPTSAASADALASYNYWKTNFVASSNCNGQSTYRVIFDYYNGGRGNTDRSSTVSEGIGYGMLLSAYAGDRALFDGFWTYYKQFRNGNGVMNYRIDNCGVKGSNGATDAELDVAMALVQASYQWQSNDYLNDAKAMIATIRQKEVESGSNILKPGDQFGGTSLVNPSYFSPAYYRVFATLDAGQSTFWNNVLAKGYDILFKADVNTSTKNVDQRGNGLVPDWCDANGAYAGGASSYEDQGKNFIYDAIRTPFRTAIDVLWHGSTLASQGQTYSTRFTNWAIKNANGDFNNVGAKYDMNGNKLNSYKNNTFIGCFAVSAMAASPTESAPNLPAVSTYPLKTENQYQAFLDNGYAANKNTSPGYGEYFNASFKVLTQFVMTGNFYLPPPDQCTAPNLGSTVSLCKGSPQVLNSGITGATSYSWKLNGNVVATSGSTYSATQAGIYEVVVKQGTCTRRSSVEVASVTLKADYSYSVQSSKVVFTNTSLGASNFTWSWKKSTDAANKYASFATTSDASYSFLTAGSYTVKLDVTNAGFSCSGTSSVEKTIVVGTGVGWVADDFNSDLTSQTWVATDEFGNPVGYKALPKTYCSKDATKQECPNNPCSYFRVEMVGGANVMYKPFGVNMRKTATNGTAKDAVLDISSVRYVSVKIRSDKAITIGVAVNDSSYAAQDPAGITSDRIFVTLAANRDTIIDLNFTPITNGYSSTLGKSVAVNYKKIDAIQFFPYESGTNATTITSNIINVDWIKVGGVSLSPPAFNLKRDKDGFLAYENPNGDGTTYVTVPSWNKKVTACSTTTTITALACTAEQARWYGSNGTTIIGTGLTSPALLAGRYFIELINQGGTLRDTVDVSTSSTVSSFTVDQNNYEARFINTSSGFNKFAWNYGDVANDLPGSTKWELGYHNYKTASTTIPKTFNVSLTVQDTICNTTKTDQKSIIINCDHLVAKPVVTAGKATGCEGETVLFTIQPVTNAYITSGYGWYPPVGATVSKAGIAVADTATNRKITFSTSGPFKIEAINDCGKNDTTINLVITPKPTSDFAAVPNGNLKIDFTGSYNTVTTPPTSYAWTFGDVGTATTNINTTSHTYANAGNYTACLTISNGCGTATQACKTVSPIITGLRGLDLVGGLKVYPTLTSSALNVELQDVATLQVKNMLGIILMEKSINETGSIDVSTLPAGTYILTISQNGEVITKQFVKQ